jgi:hypothetical protein
MASWTIAGAIGLAILPGAVVLLKGGRDLTVTFALTAVILGSAIALAVDDAAAATVEAVSTPLWVRRSVRAVLITVVVLSVGALFGAVVVSVHGRTTGAGNSMVVGVTAAGVGLAVAGLVSRPPAPSYAGISGTAAAVLFMLLVSALAYRYRWLPAIAGGQAHDHWIWIAVAAWLAAAWSTRDPARR